MSIVRCCQVLCLTLPLALGGCVAMPIPLPDPTSAPDAGWAADSGGTRDAGLPDLEPAGKLDHGGPGLDSVSGGDSALPDQGVGDSAPLDGGVGEGGASEGGPLEGGGDGPGQDLAGVD